VKSFIASFYSALRDDRGSRDGRRAFADGAKRTLAKAAMSEKCTNSEMVFGGSGLQATSKGEKLISN